jgi:2-octaprenylphenol hydroxylase
MNDRRVKDQFDIVIVGAGMVGLTLATLLVESEFAESLQVIVVDSGNEPRFDISADLDLRVSAISPGSAEILARAGVWQEIRSIRACPFVAMRVWDADGSVHGPETLRFDAADFALPELGNIVENSLIQDRLLHRLGAHGQRVQFGAKIHSVRSAGDRFLVSVANSAPVRPELLIAADGSNSFVRSAAGIPLHAWRYAQSAFVTHVRPEHRHGDTAWQRFLRSGPVALLPLADGRVSVVWSTSDELARQALAASNEELGQMLAKVSDFVLGKLSPCGPRGSFALQAQYAAKYALPGLVLVGDAAHSVHPLAGQGANLGLADAAVLADTIGNALARGEYPGDLPCLRRYERARKGANQLMLRFIDSISGLFASESATVSRLRGGGMRLFNHSGPVRRQVARVALGLRR